MNRKTQLETALNARLEGSLLAGHELTREGPGRWAIGPAPRAYQTGVPLLVAQGGRFGAIVATDERGAHGHFRVRALVAFDHEGVVVEVLEDLSGRMPVLESITRDVPAAHWQEREVAEMLGLDLADHPEPQRRLLHENTPWDHHPLRKDAPSRVPPPAAGAQLPPPPPFRPVEGEGVYEIPVGPIHAGIIEPGHFRFSAVGERILHLQIRLGWQHKGIEKLFEGMAPAAGVHLAERVSGDSTFAHALAYCRAVEEVAAAVVPPRAVHLRALALELERLANHVGDLGGLSADIAWAYGAAHFGRLRGDLLNMAEVLSGSRYLRAFCCLGGVRHDVDDGLRRHLLEALAALARDFGEVAALTFGSDTVLARMEGVGVLTRAAARAFGIIGPAARASGLAADVRRNFSQSPYAELAYQPVVETSGDVAARARVRYREVLASLSLAVRILDSLPSGDLRAPVGLPAAGRLGIGQVEGWRGEILTSVIAGEAGLLSRVRVRDPSVQNWIGLALAVESNQVSDFPLCNKSFNLSYSGSDL